MDLIRIDKLFSGLGLLTRSQCKAAVSRGEIQVNGEKCKSSDQKVTRLKDIVTYNGTPVDTREFVYYMLNKPAGVITANDDPRQKTVFDLMTDKRTDLFAVGRLDKDTTGILLITNDGDLNHRVLSPKRHVAKRYKVMIDGQLTAADIDTLCTGVDIGDDKLTLPAELELIDDAVQQSVCLTITEGRYHQVKRMFEAVGKPVIKLHRDRFGGIDLDPMLGVGSYRELTADELQLLESQS